MSYAADRPTKAVPSSFLPGSHLLCVESDSTADLYINVEVQLGLRLQDMERNVS